MQPRVSAMSRIAGRGLLSNDRSCGESSCYATTAALMSVCSKNGMLACGMDLGGGKFKIGRVRVLQTDGFPQVAVRPDILVSASAALPPLEHSPGCVIVVPTSVLKKWQALVPVVGAD